MLYNKYEIMRKAQLKKSEVFTRRKAIKLFILIRYLSLYNKLVLVAVVNIVVVIMLW